MTKCSVGVSALCLGRKRPEPTLGPLTVALLVVLYAAYVLAGTLALDFLIVSAVKVGHLPW